MGSSLARRSRSKEINVKVQFSTVLTISILVANLKTNYLKKKIFMFVPTAHLNIYCFRRVEKNSEFGCSVSSMMVDNRHPS